MELLFELPEQTELIQRIPDELKGKTCNTCVHRERHQMGGSIIQYCGIRKSKRTENGLLKIKCKMQACSSYKKLENK